MWQCGARSSATGVGSFCNWYSLCGIGTALAGLLLLRQHGPLQAWETVGQPLPCGLHRLQRPALCSWLLVGLVLQTVHTSLFVSETTVGASIGEINSVRQLAASNLTIILPDAHIAASYPLREWGLAHRVQYLRAKVCQVSETGV